MHQYKKKACIKIEIKKLCNESQPLSNNVTVLKYVFLLMCAGGNYLNFFRHT